MHNIVPPMNISRLSIVGLILRSRNSCLTVTWTEIIESSLDQNGTYIRKFFNHSASLHTLSKVMNSESIVYLTMEVCTVDFQDTTPSAKVNTYPIVNLLSLVFESNYHHNIPQVQ